METFKYLNNCIKTDIAPSQIHGIGTFALRDIKIGESLFEKWDGETTNYTLTHSEFEKLPIYVKRIILKSYENKRGEYPFVWFKLYADTYFNLANPLAYTNTLGVENANFNTQNKIAIKNIKVGEELFGTYDLDSTIL
jgi:hypothetical protein|tara:strand:- start:1646 stop:2059 length:414 start_codon:yes stop_codon:yes gene_type:complete